MINFLTEAIWQPEEISCGMSDWSTVLSLVLTICFSFSFVECVVSSCKICMSFEHAVKYVVVLLYLQ